MKRSTSAVLYLLFAVALLLLSGFSVLGEARALSLDVDEAEVPLGTTFTFQGQLKAANAPANGSYEFVFVLYDTATGGTQIGGELTREATITDGLFNVDLDFGPSAFIGNERYLETRVRPAGSSGGHTIMSPRHRLNATPYALYALGADRVEWEDVNNAPVEQLVPKGAVMFFNLGVCPSGWQELIAAHGRYLVGLTEQGQLGAQVGTALTNRENRVVGRHSHAVNDPGHEHNAFDNGHTHDISLDGGAGSGHVDRAGNRQDLDFSETMEGFADIDIEPSTTGITLFAQGNVGGTNAPYLQLLVCEKQ